MVGMVRHADQVGTARTNAGVNSIPFEQNFAQAGLKIAHNDGVRYTTLFRPTDTAAVSEFSSLGVAPAWEVVLNRKTLKPPNMCPVLTWA